MGEGELELIQRALRGDIEAWGEIVRRYKEAVFGIAFGILGNAPDAEDATQDAFIRAYENLERYDLKRRFSTWIFTITANICKNKLRRERFFAPLKDAVQLLGGEDPAEQVEREERQLLVQEALAALDEKYRAPLVLRYYGELDYKEIAEALGMPEGTVKTRIHRAKLQLKAWMEERGVKGNA
jgi:RNA polymerase sigma-70 factor (ECF subfamily)